jgi:hypothetical protein
VGRKIIALLRLGIANKTLAFIIGFVALNLVFLIPFVGPVAQVIVISLGMGAMFYALRRDWPFTTTVAAGRQP